MIEEGVTSIGNYVFYGCGRVNSVSIPSTVTKIGKGAFEWCHSLESVVIPASVAVLDAGQFRYCSSLERFTVSASTKVGMDLLQGCRKLADADGFVICQGILYDYFGEDLSPTVPEGVTIIGNEAFNRKEFVTISLPDGLTRIGLAAFAYNTALTHVTLPDTVSELESEAFEYCTALQSIHLPASLSILQNQTFSCCSSLESIVIPKNVTVIGEKAFKSCESLQTVTFPEGLTTIDNNAFDWCRSLTSLELPDSVISVGEQAFSNCTGLKTARLSDCLTEISSCLFYDCTGLTSVELPSGLITINADAFRGCSGLTGVKLPSSLQQIGGYAFSGCSSLTEIRLPNSVTQIEIGTFDEAGLTSIEISSNVAIIDEGAFQNCTDLTTVVCWGPTKIMQNAFSNCTSLRSAFLLNPSFLQYYIFSGCTSLTDVYYGGTMKDWSDKFGRYYDLGVSPSIHYSILEQVAAQLRKDTDGFVSAYEKYLSKIAGEARKLADEEREEKGTSFADQARAMQKSGRFYVNYLDLSGQSAPEEVELCAYEALCRAISEVGENCGVDFSGISGSNIPSSTVNAVASAITGFTSHKELECTVKNGLMRSKTTADIKIGNYVGGFMGQISVTVAGTGQKYTFSVISSTTELRKSVSAYFDELVKLGSAAVDNVYDAFIGSVLEAPLEKLTEQIIAEKLTPVIKAKLEEKGISHLAETLHTCVKSYQQVSKLLGLLNKLDLTSIPDAVDILSDNRLTESDYGSWNGSFEKGLSKKLVSGQKKMILDWMKFTTGDPSFMEEGGVLKKMTSIFHCPISITVYDETGTAIGYVGEDDRWYTDAIEIVEQGETKIIHSEAGTKLSFDVLGTDDGIVDCSFEDRSTDVSVGRINYYALPVQEGSSIRVTLNTGTTASAEDVTLTLAGEPAEASDFLADGAWKAEVSCSGTNGTILGAGSYVRGDKVTMAALPDEGYIFGGWYNEDGVLLSISEIYSLVIQEDETLQADFYAPQEYIPAESLSAQRTGEVISYGVTASEPDQVWLVVARYDAGGKMLGSELRDTADGQMTAESGCCYKLFLVDCAWIPLTEAVTVE